MSFSWKFFNSIIYLITVSLLVACTDHKTTIPFDFPDYKPRLIVLSSVGTMSGGEVSLSWSKPLKGQLGTVPALPKATVYLLEAGQRMNTFIADQDSLGFYAIKSDKLNLKEGQPYAIEIVLEDKGKRIISENCYLPEKPNLQNVTVEVDSQNPFWYEVAWTQGKTKEGIGTTVLLPYLLDSNNKYVATPRLGLYYLSPELRYIDGKELPERNGRRRFDRTINKENKQFAESADIRLAFLSPELALFKKELDELGHLGESIFQTVRPLYSNLKGAVGVFGLYNESSVKKQFKTNN